MLGIVSCHFNPCHFKRPVNNWWLWRESLPNIPLVSVELAFHGRIETASEVILEGDERHFLWQKECLLNVAIRHLPKYVTKVCWIDADTIYPARTRHEQLSVKLDEVPLVQRKWRMFGRQ